MTNDYIEHEATQKMQKDYPGYRIIYLTHTGSKLFGLETQNSDTDVKGIFIPSLEDLLLKKEVHDISMNSSENNKINSRDDLDMSFVSIYKFLEGLKTANPDSVDLMFSMFSDKKIIETREATVISENFEVLINNNPNKFIRSALNNLEKNQNKINRLRELILFRDFINDSFAETDEDCRVVDIFDEIKNNFIETKDINFNTQSKDPTIEISEKKYSVKHISLHDLNIHIENAIAKYGERIISYLENKNGVHVKSFTYTLRMAAQFQELAKNRFISFPLKPLQRGLLMQIKNGEINDLDFLNDLVEKQSKECFEIAKTIEPSYVRNVDVERVLKEILLAEAA